MATGRSGPANTSVHAAAYTPCRLFGTRRLKPLSGCASHRKGRSPFNLENLRCLPFCGCSEYAFRTSSFSQRNLSVSTFLFHSPHLQSHSFVVAGHHLISSLHIFTPLFVFSRRRTSSSNQDAGNPFLLYPHCLGSLPGASMLLVTYSAAMDLADFQPNRYMPATRQVVVTRALGVEAAAAVVTAAAGEEARAEARAEAWVAGAAVARAAHHQLLILLLLHTRLLRCRNRNVHHNRAVPCALQRHLHRAAQRRCVHQLEP